MLSDEGRRCALAWGARRLNLLPKLRCDVFECAVPVRWPVLGGGNSGFEDRPLAIVEARIRQPAGLACRAAAIVRVRRPTGTASPAWAVRHEKGPYDAGNPSKLSIGLGGVN